MPHHLPHESAVSIATAHGASVGRSTRGGIFWGGKGSTCEKAGWDYSVFTAYAQHAGLASASCLIDLEKFMSTYLMTICSLRPGPPILT